MPAFESAWTRMMSDCTVAQICCGSATVFVTMFAYC